MLPSWSRYVRAAGSQQRSVSFMDSTSCSSNRSLVPSSSTSSTGRSRPAASWRTSSVRYRWTVLRAPPSSTVRSRPAGWMNKPPAGTCRERLSLPWPRRTVTGPSRCRITRCVPAALNDSRYGRSRWTDRYCLSQPSPGLVRSGCTHGCRRMPLVSSSLSSPVTGPSLMPIRCALTVTSPAAKLIITQQQVDSSCDGRFLGAGLTGERTPELSYASSREDVSWAGRLHDHGIVRAPLRSGHAHGAPHTALLPICGAEGGAAPTSRRSTVDSCPCPYQLTCGFTVARRWSWAALVDPPADWLRTGSSACPG